MKLDFDYERYGSFFHPFATNLFNDFISELGLFDVPNLPVIILDRHLSDYHPIVLKEISLDYRPFYRFVHAWFDIDGFTQVAEVSWKNDGISHVNVMVLLKKNLQYFKKMLKTWNVDFRNKKEWEKNKCILVLDELN